MCLCVVYVFVVLLFFCSFVVFHLHFNHTFSSSRVTCFDGRGAISYACGFFLVCFAGVFCEVFVRVVICVSRVIVTCVTVDATSIVIVLLWAVIYADVTTWLCYVGYCFRSNFVRPLSETRS